MLPRRQLEFALVRELDRFDRWWRSGPSNSSGS